MKFKHLMYPVAAITLVTIAFACKKDNSGSSNTNTTAYVGLTTEKSTTDALIDDAFGEIMAVNLTSGLTNQASSPNAACYTVDISPADANTWPKTVTVDYGTGCTGLSGYTHKGKIIYTITNKFFTEGATITATFQNYYVNNYNIVGTYSIHNNGSANGWNVTDSLAAGKVTYPDGTTWYTKTGSRTWVQTAGQATPLNLLDDEFDVTGHGVITNSAGNSLTASTITALHRLATCTNTVSGKLDLLYDSISGVLDFGTGECDKQATLTIGTKTYPITLP